MYKKAICLIANQYEPISEPILNEETRIQAYWYQKSSSDFSLVEAFKAYPDTEILVTSYVDLSAKNLEKLPKLKAIILTSTGYEYVDSE